MGRDKALVPWGSGTLVGHVASQVAAAAGSAVIVGHPERYGGLGFPALADEAPGCGPLGGICTALAASRAEWNLVVACDMPFVTAAFLGELLEEVLRSGGDCLVPVSAGGHLEPLCAVYRRDLLTRLRQSLTEGRLAAREAVRGPGTVWWPVPDPSIFANLNTPEDLARHQAVPATPRAAHGA